MILHTSTEILMLLFNQEDSNQNIKYLKQLSNTCTRMNIHVNLSGIEHIYVIYAVIMESNIFT